MAVGKDLDITFSRERALVVTVPTIASKRRQLVKKSRLATQCRCGSLTVGQCRMGIRYRLNGVILNIEHRASLAGCQLIQTFAKPASPERANFEVSARH